MIYLHDLHLIQWLKIRSHELHVIKYTIQQACTNTSIHIWLQFESAVLFCFMIYQRSLMVKFFYFFNPDIPGLRHSNPGISGSWNGPGSRDLNPISDVTFQIRSMTFGLHVYLKGWYKDTDQGFTVNKYISPPRSAQLAFCGRPCMPFTAGVM
jgi:hypothetical protein